MANVFVVPAKDAEGKARVVPDPISGGNLPAGGAWKPRTQYWLRRLRALDVTEGTPAQAAPAAAAAPVASAMPAEPLAPKPPASEPAEAVEPAPAAPLSRGK